MTQAMKPCPFCLGEVRIALIGDDESRWFVTRGFGDGACECRVFMESRRFNKRDSSEEVERIRKELISAWNNRAERTCLMAHARWDDGQCTWGCRCSACGDRFEHETGETWRFCPNCGARVEVG